MKAIWRDEVIAESDRILEVDGYRYFPRESVRMECCNARRRRKVTWPARMASSSTTLRQTPRAASARHGRTRRRARQ